MVNGKLNGKIPESLSKHPVWKSKLTILLNYDGSKSNTGSNSNHDFYINGFFKNGKLHGIIQIFGKMSSDPKGQSSFAVTKGRSCYIW